MKVKTLTPRVAPEEAALIKEAAYRARVSQAVWMRRKLGLPDQPSSAVHTSELYGDVYGPEAACSDPFVTPRQEAIEPPRHEGHEDDGQREAVLGRSEGENGTGFRADDDG